MPETFDPTPSALEAVFTQRDETNLFYEQINISANDSLLFFDTDGYLIADRIDKILLNSGSNTIIGIIGGQIESGSTGRLSKYSTPNLISSTVTPTNDSATGISIGKDSGSNAMLDILGNVVVTGSVTAHSFTGSISGSIESASYAERTNYAATASYFNGTVTGSIETSSYAHSASYSLTSSFIVNPTNAYIQSGNSFSETAVIGTLDNYDFSFITSGSEKVRLTTSGYFGIGITNPSEKLEVFGGNIKTDGLVNVNSNLLYSVNTINLMSGSNTVVSFTSGSSRAAFFDYYARSGSGNHTRSGILYAVWSGNNIEYNETTTQDIGNTHNVSLSVVLSGENVVLQSMNRTNGWSIKSFVRIL